MLSNYKLKTYSKFTTNQSSEVWAEDKKNTWWHSHQQTLNSWAERHKMDCRKTSSWRRWVSGRLQKTYRVFTRSSKRPALARAFWIHLLEVCWTFAGSCKHPITETATPSEL